MRVVSDSPEGSLDQALVEACLNGDEHAWRELIQQYKNLIYSIPRRYGAGAADAADIFQLVCAELFVALPRLRNPRCLRAWIMTVAAHESQRWKRSFVKRALREEGGLADDAVAETPGPSNVLEIAEREQTVREAIASLPERDQQMLRMLFYSDPPVPYQTVASRLGLATGSIGLLRARCLKRLEGALAQLDVPQGTLHASVRRNRVPATTPAARTRRTHGSGAGATLSVAGSARTAREAASLSHASSISAALER